jgi:hypothetical protein
MPALEGFIKYIIQNRPSATLTRNTFNASEGITTGTICLTATTQLPKKKLPISTAIWALSLAFMLQK